jgi:hypothetical protein
VEEAPLRGELRATAKGAARAHARLAKDALLDGGGERGAKETAPEPAGTAGPMTPHTASCEEGSTSGGGGPLRAGAWADPTGTRDFNPPRSPTRSPIRATHSTTRVQATRTLTEFHSHFPLLRALFPGDEDAPADKHRALPLSIAIAAAKPAASQLYGASSCQ